MKQIKILLNTLVIAVSLFAFQQESIAARFSRTLIDSYTPQRISDAINAYRVVHGLSPLKLNSLISEEAENHSRDMANKIVPFGHAGFYARTRTLAKLFPHSHSAAENAAYADIDTEEVVKQWIKSPGHRKNIEGNYNLTGIGIARDKNGRVYVTQLFLRDDEVKG